MKLELHFSAQDMANFLRRHGFEVKAVKEEMWFSVYHNDTEKEIIDVTGVFRDGKPYQKPLCNFVGDEWLNRVFQSVLAEKLLLL